MSTGDSAVLDRFEAVAPACPVTRFPAPAHTILQRHAEARAGLEETTLGLYYAGLSVARAEGYAQQLWGEDSGVADLAVRAQECRDAIRAWLRRPLAASQPQVLLQAVAIPRSRPGHPADPALLVAMVGDERGVREVLALDVSVTAVRDWSPLLGGLRERGLGQVRVFLAEHDSTTAGVVRRFFPAARHGRGLPLRKPLARMRARLRAFGPLADDEALVLLAAAHLRHALRRFRR